MIDHIIQFSLRNKAIVGLFTLALVAWGILSLARLPVDAVPDITNNQVQIISIAPTLAVQEVERFITSPVEVSVANIPDVVELRSISRLGLSVVTVVFTDKVDIYKARMLVNESLIEAGEQIPGDVAKPELAPVSTGLGEIYQYLLRIRPGYENRYSAMDLRTIQEWIVRREMLGTPGVADVNSYGGLVKQYEVAINPERLRSMNLTLTDVFDALGKNNENTGGAYIDRKPNAYFIRGIGLAKDLEDIEKIAVKSNAQGMPILIRDVAAVQFGSAPRYGALVADTLGEAVGGVVMMLKGSNAHEVIDNVKKRLATIEKSLPEGVTIVPYLDRTHLVTRAIHTVSRNLIEGGLIVVLILVLLLGNLRAGLIVASVIPLAMLFAISMMNVFGISGNLMSLGAIDFGLIVDGAVIIVESIVSRLYLNRYQLQESQRLTQQQMDQEVSSSARRMMSSATFGQIIILIVYLPILALVGIEGKMFRPMAQVVSLAILGALLLSLTYVPVASAILLSRKVQHRENISDRIMQFIHLVFNPVILYALKNKLLILILSLVLLVFSLILFSRLGGEFLPQLNEGDLAAGVITLQGSSLSNTIETVEKANKILLTNFPEVKQAVCKIGSGEIPTDPTPMETGDYIITLKNMDEWTSAKTREELIQKMEEKLAVLPGVKFEFQQPIQMRFNELMTGSKQDVAIKIFGDNLETLAGSASEIEKLIMDLPGVQDINVEKVTGLPQIQIEYDREKIARYGLNISDVNRLVRTAFAGSAAGVIFDEEKRYDLVVRFDETHRRDLQNVQNLYVPLPSGGQISLDQLATVEIKAGPAQISRENTKRRITIGFNVRGRDVQSLIAEVRQKIERSLKLPAGYYVMYGGQFENLVAAKKRLSIAVPVSLLLIFILLFFTFHSMRETLLIFTAVPFSAIGGVLALWIRGMNFSISAGVGFIALFGVAVLNGIVLISEFNRLLAEECVTDITERVHMGLKARLRPVIMTASVASLGFLPMALSTSAGAEVQKPLATVVIGGLVTATLLTLVVLPVLYVLFSKTITMRKSFRLKTARVLFFCIMAGLAGMQHARAQHSPVKVITFDEAVRSALDSNLNIRVAQYKVEIQRTMKGQAWDMGKTNLGMEYGQMNSFSKDRSFTVSQSIAFPLVYVNQSRLANAGAKSSEIELTGTRNEITARIKSTWWLLAYHYSRLKLLEYQDSLYAGFLKAATLRAGAGETNRLEKISAESQSLDIMNQVRQTRADIDICTNRILTLMNTKGPIRTADTLLIKLTLGSQADSVTLQGNPSLAWYAQQAEVARYETALERSKILPDFTFGYFSQTIRGIQDVNGIETRFTAHDQFTGIQAGIAVPLWFYPQTARIKAARINRQMAETQAEYYRETLTGEYGSLRQEYNKYWQSLSYYEQSALPQAEMIIHQATKRYKAGAMDYLDYIQSISRALAIKSAYLETLNNFNQVVISLQSLVGNFEY
jgi:heavy metal efflux system protein